MQQPSHHHNHPHSTDLDHSQRSTSSTGGTQQQQQQQQTPNFSVASGQHFSSSFQLTPHGSSRQQQGAQQHQYQQQQQQQQQYHHQHYHQQQQQQQHQQQQHQQQQQQIPLTMPMQMMSSQRNASTSTVPRAPMQQQQLQQSASSLPSSFSGSVSQALPPPPPPLTAAKPISTTPTNTFKGSSVVTNTSTSISKSASGKARSAPNNSSSSNNNNTATTTAAAAATTSTPATSSTITASKARKGTEPIVMPLDEASVLLKQCDWIDKTLWTARHLFGGQALNGFLRATATAQRVRKQRERQTAFTKSKDGSGSDNKRKTGDEANNSSNTITNEVKVEIMNARTVKKLKVEMEHGIQFCELVHETIRAILHEMNPHLPQPEPLSRDSSQANVKLMPSGTIIPMAPVAAIPTNTSSTNSMSATTGSIFSGGAMMQPASPAKAISSMPPPEPKPVASPAVTTASPGHPNGSMLRKNRKKKLPPHTADVIALSEYDETTKKKHSKKEQLHRWTEAIRFRALRKDDFVAARVSSRDLWILARVIKNYNGFTMPPEEFLKLTEARRERLFKDKVVIKDVEDKTEGNFIQVERKFVLPLPRSFSEAADWCSRAKKGTRIYAMYPNTTSLYAATVVDNATYCRDDDDIVVVEFDGDEPDELGMMPKCHIPARFVTMIPREYIPPPANTSGGKKKKASSALELKNQTDIAATLDGNINFDDLNMDEDLPVIDDFGDLEFDL